MSIQPIDMQTLFMRLNQVGKEQAIQKEAAHLAQTQVAGELVRESEEQTHNVNESRELEDGPEGIREEEKRGNERRDKEETENEKSDAQKEPREVFRDPDLGSHVDISG